MNTVRTCAFRLRLSGLSYNEIEKRLGVPKSTLSGWFKDLVLSEKARARLSLRMRKGGSVLVKRNKLQTRHAERRAQKAQAAGRRRVKLFSKHDVLLLGAALYWAEGYKRLKVIDGKERMGHSISFLNTDPVMIALFIRFLVDGLQIPMAKIRLTMRLYPHINEADAKRYWMRASGLSGKSFQKTTTLVSGGTKRRRPFNRLPYGTLCVSVNDTERFHHLLGLIEGVKDSINHGTIPPSLG